MKNFMKNIYSTFLLSAMYGSSNHVRFVCSYSKLPSLTNSHIGTFLPSDFFFPSSLNDLSIVCVHKSAQQKLAGEHTQNFQYWYYYGTHNIIFKIHHYKTQSIQLFKKQQTQHIHLFPLKKKQHKLQMSMWWFMLQILFKFLFGWHHKMKKITY